jgi:hypothetical protein
MNCSYTKRKLPWVSSWTGGKMKITEAGRVPQ